MLNDYKEFEKNNTRIIVVSAVDDEDSMSSYWKKKNLPFEYFSDSNKTCAKAFKQRSDLIRKGMIPAQFIMDPDGTIVYAHYGWHMADIPKNKKMLKKLKSIQGQ